MITFKPFAGVRYNDPTANTEEDGVLELEGVIAPLSAALEPQTFVKFAEEELSRYNSIRLLLEGGRELWNTWKKEQVIQQDTDPLFYIYRVGNRDANNQFLQTSAVIGEISGVSPATDSGPVDVLPLIVTVDAPGFSDLLAPTGVPLARATASDGSHHRLWAVTATGVTATISEAVANSPTDAPEGSGTRLAVVAEEWNALPALGMVFRERA